MLINNAVITGSFTVNGVDVAGITGSSNVSSSYLALSASYLTTSASYASASGSLSTRVTNLESTSSTVSSSFATTSGSIAGRVTTIESKYATTGSNTFSNLQYISSSTNAQGFTTSASLYTDGGLRVGKDSFVSGTAYFNNVVVYGTSSIQYITSSQVNVGANIINLNTQTPAVRFGGMAVADSGSNAGITGSMLWDSVNNNWIYSNPSGSSYDGGMLISGPRNTTGLGNELGTTACYLMAGQGGDHITSSAVYTDSNATCFYGNSYISSTGTACFGNIVQTGCGVIVTGYPAASGNGLFVAYNSAGANTGSIYSYNYNTSTYNPTIIDGSNIYLYNSGVAKMAVVGGNVGIGTTSPQQVLQIQGNARISGQSGYLLWDDGISNADRRTWGIAANYISYGMLSFFSSTTCNANPLGACNPLNITSCGFMGISTTTPNAPLDVSSADTSSSGIQQWSYKGSANSYRLQLNTSVCSGLVRYSFDMLNAGAGYGCNLVLDRGTVGIGTGSPISTLDVRGVTSIGGGANTYSVIQRSISPGGSQGIILTSGTAKSESGGGITFADNSCSGGTIWLSGNSSDIYGGGVYIQAYGQTASANVIGFSTRYCNATLCEIMRVTSSGLAINSSTANAPLDVTSATTDTSGIQQWSYNSAPASYRLQLNQMVCSALVRYSFDMLNAGSSYTCTLVLHNGGVAIGIGSAAGNKLRVLNVGASQGTALIASDNNVYNSLLLYAAGADGYNGAANVMAMGRNTSTGRSINAGGTINASGTDYAEYMYKATEDVIEKGDVVGINSEGKLTNIFADAISFAVKSTDPSYVGGDVWGNVDVIGKRPQEDASQEEKDAYELKLLEQRVMVDRIAFSGQVPCNVLGASVGDYIIPIELENGKIGGQAVTNPALDQYRISVGRVWKILKDGRAWIAVKIG